MRQQKTKTQRRRRARPVPKAGVKVGDKLSKGALQLRAWRKDRGLTQYEATKVLRFTYDKISAFELGHRRPSLSVAAQIRELTGIATETWLEPASPSAVENGRSVSVA